MKYQSIRLMILLSVVVALAGCSALADQKPEADGPTVSIVVADEASSPERIAADELAEHLTNIYPKERFAVTRAQPAAGAKHTIYLGTPDSAPALVQHLGDRTPEKPESYVVTTATIDGRPAGLIVGADPGGVMYGVYGVLRQLGCGFYISFDALPKPKDDAFGFDGWDLADRPLVEDRMSYNWHNFLSGCSTWRLEDWKHWIRQSQKSGYNTIMVHSYGNNPMAGYVFEGQYKPIGYISSSNLGRDWYTNHVGDVRDMWGGKLFDSPVFGSEAAVGGDVKHRTDVAQEFMGKVFQCAEDRGVKVYFAVDVDTSSANPQSVTRTLPKSALLYNGKYALVNPDTPEGYQYYKAQVAHWMRAYPHLDSIVAWFRKSRTPWAGLEPDQLPPEWQKMYWEQVKKVPGSEKYWRSAGVFAISRIVRTYQKALKELGHEDVAVGTGTWMFKDFRALKMFMPEDTLIIPLDYKVLYNKSQLSYKDKREWTAELAVTHPVIPVVWAHHDDGSYFGRSYAPYKDFYQKLVVDSKCSGFGVMHWVTRPLDLYFESVLRQTWQSSQDEPPEKTCRDMAARMFGPEHAETMGEYLHLWVTEGVKFGRETRDEFVYRRVPSPEKIIGPMKKRLALLESVDEEKLTPAARERLDYFKGLEKFTLDVCRNQHILYKVKEQIAKGQLDAARRAIAEANPEETVEQFAQFVQNGGVTRGDQGLVVTMNTRWLPYFTRLRQQLAIEPVRYNYRPTVHEKLAQNGGDFTFDFGPNRELWMCFGSKETRGEQFTLPADAKISAADDVPEFYKQVCRSGIESAGPITLTIRPVIDYASRKRITPVPVAAGDYTMKLLMLEPTADGPGERVFDVAIGPARAGAGTTYRFPPVKARYLRLACRGSSANTYNSICEVRCPSLKRKAAPTASAEQPGHEAAKALDGNPATRWTSHGRDHWIQFELDDQVPTDRVEIAWFRGEGRQYDFDILTSDDGQQWTKVERFAMPAAEGRVQIDLYGIAGGRNRVAVLAYPVSLVEPSAVQVKLTPRKGKAIICGAVLEPVGNTK